MWNPEDVTAREAAGFEPQPVKPFQPYGAHPPGCARESTAQDIEGSTHPHGYRNPKSITIPLDPFFLFRCPQGDEQDVRCSIIDTPDKFFVVKLINAVHMWWVQCSDYYQARKEFPQIFSAFVDDAVLSAKQENGEPRLLTVRAQLNHEVQSGVSVVNSLFPKRACKNDASTVGEHNVPRGAYLAEFIVLSCK